MKTSAAEKKPQKGKTPIKKDVLVTTNADKLVRVLREKGEISIKDAAETLKVSVPTIESWANFLEEGGIVEITYKFTTPYLSYKSAEAAVKRFKPEEKDVDMYSIFSAAKVKRVKGLKKPISAKQAQSKISNLVKSAYFEIKHGNYERAQAMYHNAKLILSQIPHNLVELRRDIEHDLVKLNSELTVHLKHSTLKEVAKILDNVKSELMILKAALEEGRIDEAERTYERIEHEYNSFPEGFVLEKIKLQNQVLTAYRYLVNRKRHLISRTINKKVNRIVELVQNLKSAVSSNNFDQAEAFYMQIKEIYETLPTWVINEYPKLQKDIILGLSDLLLTEEKRAFKVIKEKSGEIDSLLHQIKNELKSNRVENAGRTYEKVKEIYDSLPKGFLDVKVELINKIYEVHLQLIDKLTKKLVEEFEHKQHRILRLMKRAYNHVEKGELEFAHAAYHEIIDRYNKLPHGFMELASNIRVDILNLYKELLIKSDTGFLAKATKEADELYYSILQQIISIHESIEHSEFEMMEPAYHRLIEDYGQLPLTLAQKKTHIWEEVQKIYQLLQLYNMTKALADKGIDELPDALRQVKGGYSKLLEKCPEDIMLFRHVYDVYTEHLQRLESESGSSETPEDDVPIPVPTEEDRVKIPEIPAVQEPKTKLPQPPAAKNAEKRRTGRKETKKAEIEESDMNEREHDPAWNTLMGALVDRRLKRAKMYISRGLYLEAKENLMEALDMDPMNREAKELLSQIRGVEGEMSEGADTSTTEAWDIKNNPSEERRRYLVNLRIKDANIALSRNDYKSATEILEDIAEFDDTGKVASMMEEIRRTSGGVQNG